MLLYVREILVEVRKKQTTVVFACNVHTMRGLVLCQSPLYFSPSNKHKQIKITIKHNNCAAVQGKVAKGRSSTPNRPELRNIRSVVCSFIEDDSIFLFSC